MCTVSPAEVGMNEVTLGDDAEQALSGARAAAQDAEAERERHRCKPIYRSGRRRLRNFHTRDGRGGDSGELEV
ncbi:hypothetical protein QQF64_023171 [Cirrhinus molitorella]|uniref:Uncharacterized protein n=1 Tax=Cirrhinus molitorella TaxID=172907 RepID=A0ABR3L615_9TELE